LRQAMSAANAGADTLVLLMMLCRVQERKKA
jgi:hypothetical protein